MPYPLAALPRGRVVFLDANIFVYGLLGESQQCLGISLIEPANGGESPFRARELVCVSQSPSRTTYSCRW
jgi:hypothetical protein